MKVDWFRLSGAEFYGDEARRLFDIAFDHGFDRIGADFAPWLKPARFVADVDVSGVAAAAQLSFDSPDKLIDFVRDAKLVEPSEASVKCYRRLAGYDTQEAPNADR